jgi:hypothetical protein
MLKQWQRHRFVHVIWGLKMDSPVLAHVIPVRDLHMICHECAALFGRTHSACGKKWLLNVGDIQGIREGKYMNLVCHDVNKLD